MQGNPRPDLPSLVINLFHEAFQNIPVTMCVLALNVCLYTFPAAPLWEVCVNLWFVYTNKEWWRLFLAPLHHLDLRHLFFNMLSLLMEGKSLEQRMGGGWFFYLLCVFYLLTGLMHLLLQAVLTRLNLLVELTVGCSVGFSGVLFALSVVNITYHSGDVVYVHTVPVPKSCAIWMLLVVAHRSNAKASLIGHLAGILVGLLYTKGPLETIMKTCAGWVSSDGTFTCILSDYISGRAWRGDYQHPIEDELRERRLRRFGQVPDQDRRGS
ncbi:rhomboid-related protein 4-like [Notolabrus celidotus]|uniref:rhomboid-related protein 4-like n=1 Tax=Notolabrus celidotus TaxID=1203425 RepID=UPI00148F506F|nr:rhomboid-related protein 4-like [Notolabrus celidotus]